MYLSSTISPAIPRVVVTVTTVLALVHVLLHAFVGEAFGPQVNLAISVILWSTNVVVVGLTVWRATEPIDVTGGWLIAIGLPIAGIIYFSRQYALSPCSRTKRTLGN